MAGCSSSCPPAMAAVGLSPADVGGFVDKLLDFLVADAPAMKDFVATGIAAAGHLAGRDVLGILGDLRQARADVVKIVADARAVFGI